MRSNIYTPDVALYIAHHQVCRKLQRRTHTLSMAASMAAIASPLQTHRRVSTQLPYYDWAWLDSKIEFEIEFFFDRSILKSISNQDFGFYTGATYGGLGVP